MALLISIGPSGMHRVEYCDRLPRYCVGCLYRTPGTPLAQDQHVWCPNCATEYIGRPTPFPAATFDPGLPWGLAPSIHER